MMQVLFNAVYERAKGTDKRVIFAIDEAHYLLNDSASLGYLETAVRHSRHYDLSLQFITQTSGEFELTMEGRRSPISVRPQLPIASRRIRTCLQSGSA